MNATQLRRLLPQFEIDNHPFDLGYWTRRAGKPRPRQYGPAMDGWDTCDRELKNEATRCAPISATPA